MYNKSEFEALDKKYQGNKKLNIKSIANIIDVLEKKNIEDEEVAKILSELIELIRDYDSDDKAKRKTYRHAFAKLRNHVAKVHKLQPKDTYTGMGIAIGCGLGVALGSAFSTALSTPSMILIGLPIGIGLGLAIGYAMENEAEKEGRLY